MKHIKRRFFLEVDTALLESGNSNQNKTFDITLSDKELYKESRDSNLYLFDEDNKAIGAVLQKVNGKYLTFPVPDPTLIYFNNAQSQIRIIEGNRSKLIKQVDYSEGPKSAPIHEMYDYFGSVSAFVMFLFTSIESFINRSVPDQYVYKKSLPSKTEHYSKMQLQSHLDFKTKLTKVLPEIFNKDFFQKQTPLNQHIWNLKEFRDEIVHTKQNEEYLKYEGLIKKAINFKFEKTLEASARMMNFYEPDYIVECNCGADF